MARSEDLILIDDLNVALESGTGEVAIEDWWAKVEKLETLLSGDSRCTKQDMQALQRLKDGITLATLAVREGMKPDIGPKFIVVTVEQVVRDALAALEADRPLVIPGFAMKLLMLLARLMPMPVLRWVARMSPRSRGVV